jgi:hypothetical protein
MWRKTKYSDDLLSQVENDIIANILTLLQISTKYNMPLKTIDNKFWWLRQSLWKCKNSQTKNNLWNWMRLNQTIKKEKELKTKMTKKWMIEIFTSSYWIDLQRIWIWWESCFIYK